MYSFIIAMGGFVFGLDSALISGTVNYIVQEFGLSTMQLGMAVSAPGLGVLIALPFASYICNRYGRKKATQIVALLYLISAITSAFAPNFWTLVAARFLGGLAFSSISLASMYIGEIAPPKFRGKLVAMTQINIVIGLSAAYFVNYFIQSSGDTGAGWASAIGFDQYTWRWMLGSEILPALLWYVLLFLIPESPSWLTYRGRLEEAKKTLSKIYPAEEIAHHIEEMQASLKLSAEDHSVRSQLKEIFSWRMRIIMIVAITIAIAQQSTGINAILFYAPTVFEQLGAGSNAAFVQSVWVGLISIVGTVCGLLLVDRIGRRPMIVWGMVWIIASLGVCFYGFKTARYEVPADAIIEMADVPNVEQLNEIVGVEYSSDIEFKAALTKVLGEETVRDHSSSLLKASVTMKATLVLIGILSFIMAFQFSVGPVMWVLFSEIFPISLRGTAIPLVTIITSLTSWLVQFLFPWQLANLGAANTFLFYAITVAIGLVIMAMFLKETKGLSIEEIQLDWLKD